MTELVARIPIAGQPVRRRRPLQCASCGYGIVSARTPPCPMCGGTRWEPARGRGAR